MARKPTIATGLWVTDGYHGVSMQPVEIVGFFEMTTRDQMSCEYAIVRRGSNHFSYVEKLNIWNINHMMQVPKRIRRKKVEHKSFD